MRLIDAEGRIVSGPVANNMELTLEFEIEVRELDPALTLGYALYMEDGQVLWFSYQADQEMERWPVLEKGIVRLRSDIPSKLLNEGTYCIEYVSSLFCRIWLAEPGTNVVSIYFQSQGGLSESPYWTSARGGALAPVIAWRRV